MQFLLFLYCKRGDSYLSAWVALFSSMIITMYAIAWSSYLFVAQQDSPVYTSLGSSSLLSFVPFLPWTPKRCFKVTLSVCRYIRTCAGFLWLSIDWYFQYRYTCRCRKAGLPVLYVLDPNRSESINYSIPFSHKKLDVYPAAIEQDKNMCQEIRGSPVVVFVPTAFFPVQLTSHRKAYIQLALNMQQLGYCVVIPDITYYPKDRIRQSVVDLRLALSWVGAHIATYRGDPSRIYLMGTGCSAELITLTLAQEAVVLSRALSDTNGSDEGNNRFRKEMEMPLKRTEIYAPQVRVPAFAGVILIAGLSDLIKGYLHECELGVEHLSFLHRWAGPQSKQYLMHSPTHLLDYSKSIIDPSFLPPRFLLIHGGSDGYVPISQSILLKSLLQDVGVELVDLQAFRDMTHADTLKSLLARSTRVAPHAMTVMTAIYRFIL